MLRDRRMTGSASLTVARVFWTLWPVFHAIRLPSLSKTSTWCCFHLRWCNASKLSRQNCRDLVHLLLMQLVLLQYLVKKTVSWDILLHSDVHHNQGSHKHCIDDHIAPLVTLSLHSPKVSIAYWLSQMSA